MRLLSVSSLLLFSAGLALCAVRAGETLFRALSVEWHRSVCARVISVHACCSCARVYVNGVCVWCVHVDAVSECVCVDGVFDVWPDNKLLGGAGGMWRRGRVSVCLITVN